MTSYGVESDEVPLATSEMTSEEVLMENDQDSPTVSGKSLISGDEQVAEVLEEDGTRKYEVYVTPDML